MKNNKVYTTSLRIGRYLRRIELFLFKKNVLIGKNARIDFKSRIYNYGNRIEIADNVYLRSRRKDYQAGMPFPTTILVDKKGASVIIGNNSRINGVYMHAQDQIVIGSNCVIASGVNILDTNGHELYSFNRTIGRDMPSRIIIGNNVWIGLNAIILKGSIIGDNSVISAGSVVKGNFQPNSLISGNPATTVKILEI